MDLITLLLGFDVWFQERIRFIRYLPVYPKLSRNSQVPIGAQYITEARDIMPTVHACFAHVIDIARRYVTARVMARLLSCNQSTHVSRV